MPFRGEVVVYAVAGEVQVFLRQHPAHAAHAFLLGHPAGQHILHQGQDVRVHRVAGVVAVELAGLGRDALHRVGPEAVPAVVAVQHAPDRGRLFRGGAAPRLAPHHLCQGYLGRLHWVDGLLVLKLQRDGFQRGRLRRERCHRHRRDGLRGLRCLRTPAPGERRSQSQKGQRQAGGSLHHGPAAALLPPPPFSPGHRYFSCGGTVRR